MRETVSVNWAFGPEARKGVYYLMEDSCALNEDYRNDTLPNSVVLEDTVQPGLLQVNTV